MRIVTTSGRQRSGNKPIAGVRRSTESRLAERTAARSRQETSRLLTRTEYIEQFGNFEVFVVALLEAERRA